MSPFREIWIIFLRELRRNFRSVKGLILLAITVLGGGLVAFLLAESDEVRKGEIAKRLAERNIEHMSVDDALIETKRLGLTWWFADKDTAAHVAPAPLLLVFLFTVSLWLVPAVVLVLGFDSVSGDVQHRTVRYWALRARRWSFVTSKFLGLWATCSIVALAMHLVIWAMIVFRGEATFAATLSWGFRFWLASVPIIGVWCASSVLVSGLFRTPILSLLLNGGVFFLWWLLHVPAWIRTYTNIPENAGLDYVPTPSKWLFVFPNFYDRFLLSPQASQALIGLTVTLGFAAVCVAGSSVLFAKRDL